MKNKYIKLFIVAIITMFISIVPTYAKEVSLEQQEGKSERDTFDFIIKRANSHANYVYLIGEYAFTSAYPIGLQDVMLAARSINANTTDKTNKDTEEFGKMTIYLFKPDFSSGTKKWSKTPEKVVGKTDLPEKFKVKYIDYNYVKEDAQVDTNQMVNTAMDKLSQTMFNNVNEVADNKVTVDIKTNSLKETIVKGMSSGVFTSLSTLVANTEIESIDFKYKDVKYSIAKKLDISAMTEWFDENSETIFGKPASDVILADLLDKEFEATINLGESDKKSYVSKNHGTPTETYKIKFTGTRQKVDTDNIVKTALDSLKSSKIFSATEPKNGEVTITVKEDQLQVPIQKGMGSGVFVLLQKLVTNNDVESIEFVYNKENTNLSYTLTKDFNLDDMLSWFEQNCEIILGHKVNEALTVDLINKEFTAKVNLKNYAQKTTNNPEEYKVSFDGKLPEVDSENLLKTVMEKVKKDFFEKDEERSQGQNIVVKVKDIDTKIQKGMASGLYPALSEIAKTKGIESIDFSYNGLSYKLTQDSTLEEMAEWFDTNKETIFGKKDNITLADLDKKKFTVKVNVGRVGKLKEINKDTYTIEMLKTHDVTFHDEKEKQKEVVTVYDGETIPTDEVKKRTKRDTDTEKFLGWYEEITEGNDKDEKFNFKDTPITSDIELDAHWGTKLTSEQSETMKKSSEDALTLINNAKKMTIEVEKNVIKLVYHDQGTKKLYTTLAGAGLREALHKFLSQNKDVVDSVTLSVENERGSFSVPIIDDMVKDTNSLLDSAEQFIEPFEKATGYTAMNVTMNDVKNIISGVKIKIDLKDNKVFDEGNGEYTFTLEIQPTEGE